MTKLEAIEMAKIELKKRGYKKIRNHWILTNEYYYISFNIQGSQWNKDDYYVNFLIDNVNKYVGKPLIFTTINHRFFSKVLNENNDGQINPSIIEAINQLDLLVGTYFQVSIDCLIKNNYFMSEFRLNQIQLNKFISGSK